MNTSLLFEITDTFIDELLTDMERLGRRPYAEIGVPMFLVTEDLTGTSPARPTRGSADALLLATLFAQAAEALRKRKPDLTAADIARLVEVIADRHFLALATPAFSTISELHPEVA